MFVHRTKNRVTISYDNYTTCVFAEVRAWVHLANVCDRVPTTRVLGQLMYRMVLTVHTQVTSVFVKSKRVVRM